MHGVEYAKGQNSRLAPIFYSLQHANKARAGPDYHLVIKSIVALDNTPHSPPFQVSYGGGPPTHSPSLWNTEPRHHKIWHHRNAVSYPIKPFDYSGQT